MRTRCAHFMCLNKWACVCSSKREYVQVNVCLFIWTSCSCAVCVCLWISHLFGYFFDVDKKVEELFRSWRGCWKGYRRLWSVQVHCCCSTGCEARKLWQACGKSAEFFFKNMAHRSFLFPALHANSADHWISEHMINLPREHPNISLRRRFLLHPCHLKAVLFFGDMLDTLSDPKFLIIDRTCSGDRNNRTFAPNLRRFLWVFNGNTRHLAHMWTHFIARGITSFFFRATLVGWWNFMAQICQQARALKNCPKIVLCIV